MQPYHADYMVVPSKMDKIFAELLAHKMNRSVLILNVQRKIEDTRSGAIKWTEDTLRLGHRLNWKAYPTPNIIDEYYEYLKENFRSICQINNIGNSVENRSIKAISISNGNPKNQPVVIVGGQHSREWVGVSSALYIANEIVTKFDTQPYYMTSKDWYIVPLLNPDGYAYTHTVDRLWRKNRRRNRHSSCPGVDLNRNFPTPCSPKASLNTTYYSDRVPPNVKHWAVPGVTEHYECEEDYAGPFPLSEPESIALLVSKTDKITPVILIENLLDIVRSTPRAFIDLHNYGQMVLYPWGIKDYAQAGREYLISTAEGIKRDIYNITRALYRSGTPPSLMYPVSGTAIDWFHSKGTPLSYAIENRDTGGHGFLLPPNEIEIAGKEMLIAARHVAKVLDPGIVMRDGVQHRWF
ncbi:carboxypeptidase B-like [Pectinophora gossypiella]|uniref:carboxypeptidase B-like n=1 Tax=Pectinophora gossypiella TaxID=13191 RepID=UPI00214ED0F3|nr:carboxypeptidase B-like [Pectinophora gossypiella]